MNDTILINDQWYVSAESARADERTRVLKHRDTFALFDRFGDIEHIGTGQQGLYHLGTRFLSRYQLTVNRLRPMLLNSTLSQDNTMLAVDLTTPDLFQEERLATPRNTVHVARYKLLWENVLYERLHAVNYLDHPMEVLVAFEFSADFCDIFEVRGMRRAHRGTMLDPVIAERSIELGYRGLDGVLRRTRIEFSTPPTHLDAQGAHFALTLRSQDIAEIIITTVCETSSRNTAALDFDAAYTSLQREVRVNRSEMAEITTSNEQFNDWISRSAADLHMLLTRKPELTYPYAGVPWFSTIFGRDGIITALQYLWLDPSVARGVLSYLAANQADSINAEQDAEPGKILHEVRTGEMAALHEVPFGRYYGSVDSTPLFIMLAEAYFNRSGDRHFLDSIWPNVLRALEWIDHYGDVDGDGFVEYSRRDPSGLVQQGWKDSGDSIFHADGELAEGPIAVCEVQGYTYRARLGAASLARALGDEALARELESKAQKLQQQFEKAFWCEDIGTYALALDGRKRPCRVRASNAGHLLFCGIAAPNRARRVAETLLSDDSFSGWGVRTLAASQARYNPMSYHNGSVWPHDNGIVAVGLARYGFCDLAIKILNGMFDASAHMDLHRLPELFCGFKRLPGKGPTLYPVACSPQAWASGALFHLLQACLNLSFSPTKPQLRFSFPQLPEYLQRVQIKNLRMGGGTLDLMLHRHPRDVGVNVVRKEGDVEVTVLM